MKPSFAGFDPLVFLDVANINSQTREDLSKEVMEYLTSYVITKVAMLLPKDCLTDMDKDPQKFIATARNYIPDLDDRIKSFAEEFKREFHNNLKKL